MNTSRPAVTVAVAARNYGRYLPEALDSVLAQTWTDWECLVVDDGSTDDTPSVMGPYLNDPRFRYHRTEGLGQSRAKNLCWRLARAPLVAYLDADDVWLPAKLQRQMDVFRANPELGMVHTLRSFIGPDGEPSDRPSPPPVRGRILDSMLVRNSVCFSSVMLRREALAQLGGFDPGIDLSIDFDLWLRLTRRFEVECVDEVLVRYRTGHGNLSQRTEERVRVSMTIKRRFLERWGNSDSVPAEVQRRAWGSTWFMAGFLRRDRSIAEALVAYWKALCLGYEPRQTWRAIGVALLIGAGRAARLKTSHSG